MRLFSRGLQHPFYPTVKPTPAARAEDGCPALSGTFDELARAAAAGLSVTRAVFPLCRAAHPFLPAEQRDALWRMFEVPVLALLLDGAGRVIGYECEVQEGFHLAPGHAGGRAGCIRPLQGTLDSTLCECGRPGPRLLPDAVPAELAAGRRSA